MRFLRALLSAIPLVWRSVLPLLCITTALFFAAGGVALLFTDYKWYATLADLIAACALGSALAWAVAAILSLHALDSLGRLVRGGAMNYLAALLTGMCAAMQLVASGAR